MKATENTDTELFREPGAELGMDYYQPSVHVTKQGLIGIDVGGEVIQLPIRKWHEFAKTILDTAPNKAL